ncbi:proline dehydrogenase family protein, partial [Tenacibaculum maritimum]
MKLFDNTEIAFALKSDSALERAYFLFRMIQNQPMVRIGTAVTNFALKAHLPVEGLIRSTVFDHFCGGVTEDNCLPVIEKMYEKGKVHSVLDYSVEGKESEEEFDNALEKTLKTIDFAEEKKSIPYAVFKPTGFGRFALYEKISEKRVLKPEEQEEWNRVVARFHVVCKAAKAKNVPVLIDAEESWMQNAADDLIEDLMEAYNTEKAIVFNT